MWKYGIIFIYAIKLEQINSIHMSKYTDIDAYKMANQVDSYELPYINPLQTNSTHDIFQPQYASK